MNENNEKSEKNENNENNNNEILIKVKIKKKYR